MIKRALREFFIYMKGMKKAGIRGLRYRLFSPVPRGECTYFPARNAATAWATRSP